jgi:hypothetical protein
MKARAFHQVGPGREEGQEAVGGLHKSQHHRSPKDLLDGEQFHVEETYTGEFVVPLFNNFGFVHFTML